MKIKNIIKINSLDDTEIIKSLKNIAEIIDFFNFNNKNFNKKQMLKIDELAENLDNIIENL